MIQKGTKTNVSAFIDQLNTRRAEMDAERIVMSDTAFGLLYNVSCCTVTNYMGYMKKNISYKSTIKTVSKSIVNGLRTTHSDTFVAKQYGCSLDTINKNFGTREELGLPKYGSEKYKNNTNAKKKETASSKNSVTAINRRLEATKVVRKEDRWMYPVEKPYWDQSNEVQLYNGPHKFLYQKIA